MSEIKTIGSVRGSLSTQSTLKGSVSTPGSSIKGQLSSGTLMPDEYKGEYEVTSDTHETQVLNTAKKYLKDDIVVKPVPYSETTNPSDGLTVYIGKDVLINV